MVAGVRALAKGWKYDDVSIGYPGVVVRNRPTTEPHNLGKGWVGFDYEGAFGCPVRIVNDAAMQALGGYNGGKMLFLGFGTGLGTTLIVDGVVVPMELAHLPYRKATFEDYVGEAALEQLRQEEVAQVRRRRDRAPGRGARARRRRARRRQRAEPEGAAAALPHRREHQRVPRRLPAVGRPDAPPSRPRRRPPKRKPRRAAKRARKTTRK